MLPSAHAVSSKTEQADDTIHLLMKNMSQRTARGQLNGYFNGAPDRLGIQAICSD